MVPWCFYLATSYHDWKSKPSKPALWPYPPGIGFQVPGCTCDRSDGQNPSRKMTASWQMRMDFFLHLPVWTLIKSDLSHIYIYIHMHISIYAFMYGKIKENSDTKFWFVLICVLSSRLLWGVPPHQIPLKPPNLQLWTLHPSALGPNPQCFQGTLPRFYIVKNHGFQHYAVKW